MKIMLDTNVLISALVFGGKPRRLITQLLLSEHEIYISEYVDAEFKEIIHLKWQEKEEQLIRVYRKMNFIHCTSTQEVLGEVRDAKDVPVLSDAIFHQIDILLTGDKDFLEAGIVHPLVYSPGLLCEYLHIE